VVVIQSNLIHFLDIHAVARPFRSDLVSVSVVCSETLNTAILGEMIEMPSDEFYDFRRSDLLNTNFRNVGVLCLNFRMTTKVSSRPDRPSPFSSSASAMRAPEGDNRNSRAHGAQNIPESQCDSHHSIVYNPENRSFGCEKDRFKAFPKASNYVSSFHCWVPQIVQH
jgi:hypothetical protein